LAFPSDSVLAHVVLEAAESQTLTAQRLQRIWIHVWDMESVYLLEPGTQGVVRLCGQAIEL
jgi:hypothetical protein